MAGSSLWQLFLFPVFCHRSVLAGKSSAWFSSAELTLSFDARVMTEYREVLIRPKFKFDKDKIDAILDNIEHRGVTVASSPLPLSLPDIDDEAFLEAAIAAKSVCIATGNKIHFPPVLCLGTKIFSLGDFLTF